MSSMPHFLINLLIITCTTNAKCPEIDGDFGGSDIQNVLATDWPECADDCASYSGCVGWVYDSNTKYCWLKSKWDENQLTPKNGLFSGSNLCTQRDYTYLGCYKDTSNRALRYRPSTATYTITSCSVACNSYKYFSLQYNGECWCDNDLGHATKYGKIEPSTCPSNQLGASWANDLFQNSKDWKVYIEKATGLSDEDDGLAGKSDPFVTIIGWYCDPGVDVVNCEGSGYVKSETIETSRKDGTHNPTWDTEYNFGASTRYYYKFIFSVDDYDSASPNDFIGSYTQYVGYKSMFGGGGSCSTVSNCKCGLHDYNRPVMDGSMNHGRIYVQIINPNPNCL